jgi:hypothetical protein
MFFSFLRRFNGGAEMSTPLQFLNLRYFASKGGKGGSSKSKKQTTKKNTKVGRPKKDQIDSANEYFEQAKKSGKQIYKGVKEVVTGNFLQLIFVGKGKAASKNNEKISDRVPPNSINKYDSKQVFKEAFQSTTELVKEVGQKVMKDLGNGKNPGKGYNSKVDTEKIKELGRELNKKDEDFNQ